MSVLNEAAPPIGPIDSAWELEVIRDGIDWIARARCVSLVDLGVVSGATEEEAMAQAEAIVRSVRIRFGREPGRSGGEGAKTP